MKKHLKNSRLRMKTTRRWKKWNLDGWRTGWNGLGEWSRHLMMESQDEWRKPPLEALQKLTIWDYAKEIKISQKALSKWVEFLYINYPNLNLQEPNLSIYNRRGLKWNTNETQVPSKFKCKMVPPSHEVSVIHFLFSTPPKMRLHPPNYSHSLFNIHTSYNYTKVIQMMIFYLMLGLAPHGLDLGFLRLGLWAWASSFAKTNKNNFKWFGPCSFFLLTTSFWFSSYSPNWREFVHEFSTPA